jgi:glycosyltransferase involved in cell wall biosynthesis
LRIAFVTPYFYPDWHYGGTPRAAFELARGLVARGHDVRVLTTGEIAQRKDIEGIHVRYYRNVSAALAYRQRIFLPLGFRADLEQQLSHCDVVHIHEFRSTLTIPAVRVARRSGLPYVLSPHGGLQHLGKRLAKRVFDLFWGRSILENAAGVFVLSRQEKADALSFGVDPARIYHIANPIDAKEYASLPERGSFRKRWKIPSGKIILFLGRLNRIKGVDLLVEACRELQGIQLVLAGPDEGETAEDVLMTGFLDHPAKLEALVDSDVVVLPSRSEGSPVVLFEALLCNKPVVVSSACELPMAEAESHGIVQFRSLDIPDLGRKLLFALTHAHLSDNAAVGREFVLREFSPQAVAGRAEEIYEEVLFREKKSSTA